MSWGFPGGAAVKTANAGAAGSKISWGKKWQPTAVFLPGKFHGQRNLAGYHPRGRKEWDTTEHPSTITD